MQKLIAAWNFLDGKKTYIIGILTILLGLWQHNQEMVMNGVGMITIRHAIQ